MKRIWFLILFSFGLMVVHPVQAADYAVIAKTETITITEADRYFDPKSYASKEFFIGEVNPEDNLTYVKLTVKKLEDTPPLTAYISYTLHDETGIIGIPVDASSNGTLNPYNLGRAVQEGDVFEFAFNWTSFGDYRYKSHDLDVEIETTNDTDYTGKATFEVYYTLSGIEEEDDEDKDSIGFDWLIGIVTIAVLASFPLRKQLNKKDS